MLTALVKNEAVPGKANPDSAEVSNAEKRSYAQILKSSAIVGGSQVAQIAIGVARTKIVAVLLGPAGVGLSGLYSSISDLAMGLAGMGISSSGVRQVAEAAGHGDTDRIARTATVLRRTSVVLGLLGGGLLIAFSPQISQSTFGTKDHTGAICLLSAAVLFRLLADGQSALIQGLRRIGDLARISVLGTLLGTALTIVLVSAFGKEGIVPSIVSTAAATLLATWWYRRRIQMPTVAVPASEARREASAILKLGLAFMASGLMMMGSAYAIRLMITRRLGVEATGLYQSAWTLGGLYIAFILQAMGADFYPRLTAKAHDNAACNRLVNEQAYVGLLLAGPGVIATITIAPLIMALFYTAKFEGAVPILRWICVGMTLRVINWPMGFIILAKGRQDLLIWTDLSWLIAHVGLASACLMHFGVSGAGIAFFGSYVLHGCIVYPMVRRISGFGWSDANKKLATIFLPLIGVVFCGFYLLPAMWAVLNGLTLAILTSAYSVRVLLRLIAPQNLPMAIKRFGMVR